MSKIKAVKKSRLETLDHLRGFFIIVIIIDHLSRWPSLLGILTGKALLWVTAAEGFVAISGLLVGYVRGYKNRALPLKEVSLKLIKRAGLLYLWSIIASIAYVAIIWYVPMKGGSPSTPMAVGDWTTFLVQLVTMQYTFVWVHFLTLYALFLAAAPIAIWLLRQGLAWVVALLSFLLLVLGWVTHHEALQWQFLFFIPSIVGFYLHTILNWWHGQSSKKRTVIATTTVALTAVTIIISTILAYYAQSFQGFADQVNMLFAKESVSLLRAAMAFLWFAGFLFIFYALRRGIAKGFNWLLIPIGTHSLTAYILHGVALIIISSYTINEGNVIINTLLGIIAVMIVWGLLKIPLIRRVIPA